MTGALIYMLPELSEYLERHQAIAEESVVWGQGSLPFRMTVYLAEELPPLEYVTSVRAVVLRDAEVLVVLDESGDHHVLPGGRREHGESIEETLRRELLEETGWAVGVPHLVGVLHLHHLAACPTDYPYPFPDLLQLVYCATAVEFRPEAIKPGEPEVEARFRPVDEALRLGLPESQQLLLHEALTKTAGDL